MSKLTAFNQDKYQIIYADPPYDYRGSIQQGGEEAPYNGGAKSHYPSMTHIELCSLDVKSIADKDALLFLWSTSPHLNEAVDLIRQWGFEWATVGFVWDKKAVNPGFYTMSQCELCLIGKKGRIPKPRGARNIRQFVSERRTSHSTKPEEVRRRIEAMFPMQRKVELFARRPVEGWDVWGNEVEPDIQLRSRS